jgi:hypothetical protein
MPELNSVDSQDPSTSSASGCLARIFWTTLGNIVALLCVVWIVQSKGFSAADLAYWLLIGSLIGVRYLDISRFQGASFTSLDIRATLRDWRRYSAALLLVSLLVWLFAHIASGRW